MESKRGRIRRVKHQKAALTILAAFLISIALADDFKTINGKEYKNVTVSRVEPDGKNRRKPKSSNKRQSCALRMNVLPK